MIIGNGFRVLASDRAAKRRAGRRRYRETSLSHTSLPDNGSAKLVAASPQPCRSLVAFQNT